MANRTTYTQARANLASFCDRVAETREPYVIERRNGENVALISEADFRAFTFTNVVELYRGMNPDFFVGTVVADAAEQEFARRREGKL